MESRLDDQKTRLLNNLANSGNAYGFPASDRDAWAEGLEVPRLSELGDAKDIEVLYWVGCSGSYDARNQKVSRALVRVLKAANVRFAILGKEERCNGDPARRLGEEGRFQELVIANAERFKKYNVKRVIAQCPHCFNTLRNEYRRFGVELEVEHHTQFVRRLVDAGRLKLAKSIEGDTTYHDPCYLGRYNDEYAAPRQVLIQLQKGPITEMPRSHNHSFCCGAGGSNMWFEVKEEKRRMSHIRLEEAKATGAKRMATACPFCMTMFDDATRVLTEGTFEVKDFAELVADALEAPS
jgi:Fe-S oxidoreductase